MPSLLRRTLHALRATHIPYLTPALRGLRPPFRILLTTTKLLCAAHLVVVYLLPSWGTVSGPSMLPLFEIWGQGAVTSRTHAHGRGIVVGDVVKFKLPVSGEGEAIKRVMGMPGDYVLVGSPDRGGEGEMIQVSSSFSSSFPREETPCVVAGHASLGGGVRTESCRWGWKRDLGLS